MPLNLAALAAQETASAALEDQPRDSEVGLGGAVGCGHHVEPKVARQGVSHLAPHRLFGHVLYAPSQLESGDPAQVDRSKLVAENHAILGLASVAVGNRYLTGVLGISRGYGTDRRHARSMEGLV